LNRKERKDSRGNGFTAENTKKNGNGFTAETAENAEKNRNDLRIGEKQKRPTEKD